MSKLFKSLMLFTAVFSASIAIMMLVGAFLLPSGGLNTKTVQQAAPTVAVLPKPIAPEPPPEPEVLGSATTTFWTSSANRKFNIGLGASKVSDVIVEPGEVYSFLEHLGNVSLATGYKKELVISQGSTHKEAGGGICQVSTTLFRAVVDAGLPVVERHGHGYIVGYYGAGLDATIYGPWTDFKFLNDTEYPITVKSTFNKAGSLSFQIVGVPDGRSATTSKIRYSNFQAPPKPVYTPDFSLELGKQWCTESAIRGMDTEVTYTITKKDGTVLEQVFVTHYKPWGKRCYMGVKLPKK